MYTHSIIESMTGKDMYIVLMGDSILKNDTYVKKGHSVGDLVKSSHINTIVVAVDGGMIPDLNKQFNNIPSEVLTLNPTTVISIGGNDILQAYIFGDVNDYSIVDEMFNRYKRFLDSINKQNIVLCTIYYPRSSLYVRYYDLIELWNNKLIVYANTNNYKIIYLDEKINKSEYFTHDIEPSEMGGRIISDIILSLT
jgi:hypothetical protein